MKYEESARRLREALDKKGMRPIDLAQRTGLNKASISQYYNGTHKPSKESAEKMAAVLGVDSLWLMGYDLKQAYYHGLLIREADSIITDKPYLMNLLEAAKDLSKEEVDSIIVLIERLTK